MSHYLYKGKKVMEMSVVNEDWIVKRKHNIKVGDMVSPLRAPRRDGVTVFTPVVGIVVEITKNHIALEVGGREGLFYCFADSLFAVDSTWSDGDDDE